MNPSNRKRFRARLTVLEAKESEHLLQRLKREEYEKHTNRIDLLRSKPEFELTPGELLALVLRQDPMYPAMKAWGRALRESQLQERKEYPHLHRSRVPKPCPACRTMSEQPPVPTGQSSASTSEEPDNDGASKPTRSWDEYFDWVRTRHQLKDDLRDRLPPPRRKRC